MGCLRITVLAWDPTDKLFFPEPQDENSSNPEQKSKSERDLYSCVSLYSFLCLATCTILSSALYSGLTLKGTKKNAIRQLCLFLLEIRQVWSFREQDTVTKFFVLFIAQQTCLDQPFSNVRRSRLQACCFPPLTPPNYFPRPINILQFYHIKYQIIHNSLPSCTSPSHFSAC